MQKQNTINPKNYFSCNGFFFKEPIFKDTKNGNPMGFFCLGINYKMQNKDGYMTEDGSVKFQNVCVFEPELLEILKGCKKGSHIELEGQLKKNPGYKSPLVIASKIKIHYNHKTQH